MFYHLEFIQGEHILTIYICLIQGIFKHLIVRLIVISKHHSVFVVVFDNKAMVHTKFFHILDLLDLNYFINHDVQIIYAIVYQINGIVKYSSVDRFIDYIKAYIRTSWVDRTTCFDSIFLANNNNRPIVIALKLIIIVL